MQKFLCFGIAATTHFVALKSESKASMKVLQVQNILVGSAFKKGAERCQSYITVFFCYLSIPYKIPTRPFILSSRSATVFKSVIGPGTQNLGRNLFYLLENFSQDIMATP